MIKYTIVTTESGELEALYANGDIVAQGKRILAIDALGAITSIVESDVEYVVIPDCTAMPQKLKGE